MHLELVGTHKEVQWHHIRQKSNFSNICVYINPLRHCKVATRNQKKKVGMEGTKWRKTETEFWRLF